MVSDITTMSLECSRKKAGKKGKLIPPGNTGIAQGCNKARRTLGQARLQRYIMCSTQSRNKYATLNIFQVYFQKKKSRVKMEIAIWYNLFFFKKWQWIIWTKVQRGRIWGRHSAVGKCLWEEEAFCSTAPLCLGFYRPFLTYSASSWKITRNPPVDSDNWNSKYHGKWLSAPPNHREKMGGILLRFTSLSQATAQGNVVIHTPIFAFGEQGEFSSCDKDKSDYEHKCQILYKTHHQTPEILLMLRQERASVKYSEYLRHSETCLVHWGFSTVREAKW